MNLNFNNHDYFVIANQIAQNGCQYVNTHTPLSAFLICIKDLPFGYLDNLCRHIQSYLDQHGLDATLDECYLLTQNQGSLRLTNFFQSSSQNLLDLAYECLMTDQFLGTQKVVGTDLNSSSWLSHSLYEGLVAKELAEMVGLDSATAQKLGLLHDIGRKKTHRFGHVVEGFQILVDAGWLDEAFCCLTHSFLSIKQANGLRHGGRFCDCGAVPTFEGPNGVEKVASIDCDFNVIWNDSAPKDDMTSILECYNYSPYDCLLNLADLMATANGITAPHLRVADIATRRTADPVNHNYFLATLTTNLYEFMSNCGIIVTDYQNSYSKSPNDIENIFTNVSTFFYDQYLIHKSNKESVNIKTYNNR